MLSDCIILYHQLFFCSCLESCGLHHLISQMLGTFHQYFSAKVPIGFPGETGGCQLHPSMLHKQKTQLHDSELGYQKLVLGLIVLHSFPHVTIPIP